MTEYEYLLNIFNRLGVLVYDEDGLVKIDNFNGVGEPVIRFEFNGNGEVVYIYS